MKPPDELRRRKALYKLIIAQSDILAAYTACDFFLKNINSLRDARYEPLFSAIAICYARPFVDNKSLGRLPGCWEKFGNKQLQKAHDDLLKARHEVVAHSDMKIRKVMFLPPGVTLAPLETAPDKWAWQIETYRFPIRRFYEFHALFVDVLHRIEDAIQAELVALYGKESPSSAFQLSLSDGA